MALDHTSAIDAILKTLNDYWASNAAAANGGELPQMVFEFTERSLTPHPRDGTKAWARAVVRHADSQKVTLRNAAGNARYRRTGLVWVQIFVPFVDGSAATRCQALAAVAQSAYEGKSGAVVYTKATIVDKSPDGPFQAADVKVPFYWDQIR